jgi:hypothetical protein
VNTRQVATGTILTASLLLGGAAVADARPNNSAMDRGVVPCEDVLDRVEGLSNAVAHMEARKARLEAALADAQADGAVRRVARIERQIAQVDRVIDRLQARIDRAQAFYDEHCAFQGT